MRLTILGSATIMFIVGVLSYEIYLAYQLFLNAALLGFILGGLNLLVAVLTRAGGGVEVSENSQSPLKMFVDKAVLGTTIYTMAFSDNRMVLKRLSSGMITVVAALVLALMGFLLASLIGALMGGLTAFSLQEFATQKKRELVKKGDLLDASGKGDLEIPFSELEKVELTRNRIRLYLKDRLVRVVVSRKYPDKMRPTLQRLVGAFVPAESR